MSVIKRISEKHILLFLLLLCFVTRVGFKYISGKDNFELFKDAYRYSNISDSILNGQWAMDINAYIVAPLYPLFLALIKYISGSHWEFVALFTQFFLVGISTVWIYKLTLLLTRSQYTGVFSAVLFLLYPLCLWYNFTFVQETLFQSLFIGVIYFLYKSFKNKCDQSFYFALGLLSLSLLTKSHILIGLPFFAVWILYYKSRLHLFKAVLIILTFCLPSSIMNFKHYDIMTLSSAGSETLFLLGHSNATYPCLIDPAGKMEDFHTQGCDADFVFKKDYPGEPWHSINNLPPKERFQKRREMAFNWIKENPKKFVQLKLHGLKRFVLPGLDSNQYPVHYWMPSFILGLLIYLPSLALLLRDDLLDHAFKNIVLILFISIFLIFLIFFPINRFRVITLEPALILIAGIYYSNQIKKWLQKKNPTAIT